MKRVSPSEATYAALAAVCGEFVSGVLVPDGYWHEFRPDLKAYDPGSIRLETRGGSVLELWSAFVRPTADPFCEPFILMARYRGKSGLSWLGASVSAEISWQSSPPLEQLLGGRQILGFEDFPSETVSSEGDEVVLASKGVRMNVADATLDILVNLEPAAFLVSAPGMPVFRTEPTGEMQWLSRTYKRPSR